MKKIIAVGGIVLAASLALAACAPPTSGNQAGGTKKEQVIKAAWNQPFYSYNNNLSSANAVANTNIIYMTSDGLNFYDKSLNLVPNKSFGTYTKVSDNPLTIKVEISDKAKWSDGTPVTVADYMLAFGASSGNFNTLKDEDVKALRDKESDAIGKVDKGVYFDSSSPSLALITEAPKAEGKTFTYTYSKPFADWETSLISPGLPAHIVGKRALQATDAKTAADEVLKAFQTKDAAKLGKIANVWNIDWNYNEMPKEQDLLVVNGPMMISEFVKEQFITLVKNPKYEGDHKTKADKIIIRFVPDAQAAVQALQNGEVQVINPQATSDILKNLQGMANVTSESSTEATYEHIDLTMNNGGPFDPATYGGDKEKAKKVRQAFLHTVPRQDMIDKLIKPLDDKAKIRNSFTAVPGTPRYDALVASNGMESTYKGGPDIEKAKSLLKEAGVDKELNVRFMHADGNQRRVQTVQLVAESAAKAGFKVVAMPEKKWSSKLGDKSYDAVTFGWASSSTGVTESDATYRTGGFNNKSGYSNPAVDKAFDELQVATDDAKKTDALKTVEKNLMDDAFGFTIYQFPGVAAWAKNISNVSKLTLTPTIFWNFWEWEVK